MPHSRQGYASRLVTSCAYRAICLAILRQNRLITLFPGKVMLPLVAKKWVKSQWALAPVGDDTPAPHVALRPRSQAVLDFTANPLDFRVGQA